MWRDVKYVSDKRFILWRWEKLDERTLRKYYKEQYDPINERRNVYSKVIRDRALSTNFFPAGDIRCIFASISHVDTTHQMICNIRIRKCFARDLHSGCGKKIGRWHHFVSDSSRLNFISDSSRETDVREIFFLILL